LRLRCQLALTFGYPFIGPHTSLIIANMGITDIHRGKLCGKFHAEIHLQKVRQFQLVVRN
jgi:hypothetical protein